MTLSLGATYWNDASSSRISPTVSEKRRWCHIFLPLCFRTAYLLHCPTPKPQTITHHRFCCHVAVHSGHGKARVQQSIKHVIATTCIVVSQDRYSNPGSQVAEVCLPSTPVMGLMGAGVTFLNKLAPRHIFMTRLS